MPLLVGPGVIAQVILYANEVESKSHKATNGGLILVCVGVSQVV
jgi:small neutral amino acid transporter SnatA (MarC family)